MPKRTASKKAETAVASNASYDPARPIQVTLRFDSPHVVTYHLWYATPGGSWIKFASGTDEDVVSLTQHQHQVGPLPVQSRIGCLALFVGNPNTTHRGQLAILQGGQILEGSLGSLDGTTDGDGAAVARVETTL